MPQLLDVIGVTGTTLVTFLRRHPGSQLHGPVFVCDEAGSSPAVILALGQHMPAQRSELACYRNGGNLVATTRADTDEEGAQWARCFRRCPGRLNQHRARMAAPGLTDPAMMGRTKPRLAHPRVQPEVAHQFLRRAEPIDAANRRHQPGCHRQINSGDGQQPLGRLIFQSVLGDVAVEDGKVLSKPVQLADMARDGEAFVFRHWLAGQPVAATLVEEIGMRTFRDQMRMEDGMHLIFDPGPVPDNLIATRHEPAHALCCRIRGPDLRQVASGM